MIVLAVALALAAPQAERMIASFDSAADSPPMTAHSVRLERVPSSGCQALRVQFEPVEWPNVFFTLQPAADWSGYGGLALDVTNPGTATAQFNVRIDDDLSANGVTHCRTATGSIAAGKTGRFVVPMGADPMSYGMRGLPPANSPLTQMGAGGGVNAQHIVAFQVFCHNPPAGTTLLLDNIRLVPLRTPLEGIVDRWGQYAKAEWPGKLHGDADFGERRTTEDADLSAHPSLVGFDGYGGWADGPKLKATGFFRTERVNGKWWLVTPEGKLFFSIGMDCVGDQAATIVTGREKLFTELPERSSPLGRFYGRASQIHSGPVKEGDTYNFLAANLQRKYDDGFERAWLDLSLRRLRSWGFNTVANWSDQRLYGNGRVPYVATAGIGGRHARVASGTDYWGTMHDPFDPQFAADVHSSLSGLAGRVKGDPWCIGWFVDNELSWGSGGSDRDRYGLAFGALSLDAASSPAKRALLEQLRANYRDAARLAAAWGVPVSDWAALEKPWKQPGAINAAERADLAAYMRSFAAIYFRTIRDELRRLDPDHLYLGCRFAWYTPEEAEAAAEYCDVVSYNIYQPKLDAARAAFFAGLGKPCIIGEFHFGALDRGMFHTGLVATASQAERAKTYIDYLRSVADSPSFVGCHWFQYTDEPLTGRSFDGENYNIGFVTATDTPYSEMVAAARSVHAELYARRSKPAEGPPAEARAGEWRNYAEVEPVARTNDAYPLSDQSNRAGWRAYPPMSDEFNGGQLDAAKWLPTNPTWTGREPAFFNPANVELKEGCLCLTMRKEEPPAALKGKGYHTYSSAAVQSKERVRYGYFEVRAKPMRSAGSSAFWFYAQDRQQWTEIDVFEIGGRAPGKERKDHITLHVMKTPAEERHWQIGDAYTSRADLDVGFHVYGLEWDEKELKFYFDGALVRSGPNTHWHQPLTMNFDSETMPDWFGLPKDADLPSTYQIDYIRTWKRTGE